jgi:hypothetical protein
VSILSNKTEDDGTENKCNDVCVMILNDCEWSWMILNDSSVRFKEVIVPWVKLADLNVINPM